MGDRRTCEVVEDGKRCGAPHYGNGLCNKHWQRQRKRGSVHRRERHIEFIRRAAWTETDQCIQPPWYDGTRPVVKVKGVRRTAARQAWIERFGDPGPHLVLHACSDGSGDRGCINVRHLYLGDDGLNVRDRHTAGRTFLPGSRGEDHGQSKLTASDVRAIRQMAAAGTTHEAIAAMFPVSRRTVSKIVRRERWDWLD